MWVLISALEDNQQRLSDSKPAFGSSSSNEEQVAMLFWLPASLDQTLCHIPLHLAGKNEWNEERHQR